MRIACIALLSTVCLTTAARAVAAPPATSDKVKTFAANSSEEPIAETYSHARGVEFLQRSATRWSERRKCITCHTNGLALMAQPVVAPGSKQVDEGRTFASDYVRRYIAGEKKPRGQHGAIEGIVVEGIPRILAGPGQTYNAIPPGMSDRFRGHGGPVPQEDSLSLLCRRIGLSTVQEASSGATWARGSHG